MTVRDVKLVSSARMGAPAPKSTKAVDQGLTRGAWDYLGPFLELAALNTPYLLSWTSEVDPGVLGPCGRVNLFPSSTRRSHGGSTYQKKEHVRRRPPSWGI